MSAAPRTEAWYVLHDRGGEIEQLERRLDALDWEIIERQRIAWRKTAARLRALGFDESKLRPPPPMHECERRSRNHPTARTDVEAIIRRAQAEEMRRARW